MSKNIYLKIGLALLSLVIVSAFGFRAEKVSAQKKKSKTAVVKSKSLCQANEQTIWSCKTTKNKIASVCGAKNLTAEVGYVQYRFGVLGKVELEFPKNRKDSQKAFKYLRYTRPLVTLLTLSFENNGVAYEIHDDDNSEEKPPIRIASIDIKDGAKELSVVCRQPTAGSLMTLEDFVPRDEEN
jgi:hypothetical protein